jgi:hypothetical protein
MKKMFFAFLTTLSLSSLAQAQGPDFNRIFREIRSAATATESINVRARYLSQMRNLQDFNRLTDLEQLSEGEDYFDHYRKALGKFVFNNVDRFMLDRGSDVDQDFFARKLVAKAFDARLKAKMLEKGLFYVEDCDDFKSYVRMAKAPSTFSSKYQLEYCSDGGGGNYGPGNTFELISNLTLVEGDYKQIYLPSHMYVKKLYISVAGINRSAYFDVMVNGDIKGTIYAPGRDPLYIINVSDSTNVINLRSMYGDAYIKSIKVEYR